jgi:glycosyltransferase involved in cell wall biosynthesis
MKLVSITCYFDPHYIRSTVLEQALHNLPDIEVTSVRNTHRGLLRYYDVLRRLLYLRLSGQQPDVYLLNFRGYEMLPFVLLLAGKTPVIFDEFINPVEVLAEHRKQKSNLLIKLLMGTFNLFAHFYYWLLKHCRVVLIDTEAHKLFTAHESGLPLEKYAALPVGTDEQLFKPTAKESNRPPFQVFYYGAMVPLHGVDYLIQAAEMLKDVPEITFLIAGKTARYTDKIAAANKAGARITCLEWINLADIPTYINQSAINVGGPFGGTQQAQYVVTGKTYQYLASQAVALVGQNQTTTMFDDKVNALVVPQADAQALADSIRWAYEHQDKLATIAANGRALYDQQFSSVQIEKQLASILQSLAR